MRERELDKSRNSKVLAVREFFGRPGVRLIRRPPAIALAALAAVVVILVLSPGPASGAGPAALQANLLQNPSFEAPYSGTAQGWAPQHIGQNDNPKPPNCSEYYLVLPKWSSEANQALIRDGFHSQHIGNEFDTWRAVVMQNVNVTPGTRYRFSFWAIGRASQEQFPAPSDPTVNMGVRARIDPNGSGTMFDGDIVSGAAGSPHDSGNQSNWQQFSVEATATGNQITVFAEADFGGAGQCRAHLDIWFDTAELIEVAPPPTNTPPPPPTLPPPPPATNTPLPPTNTPTPEATPTDTPTPTNTPTNTPEPPQGGIICANAFADVNGNGQRDSDEGYMAGVTLTIAQNNEVVAQGVSPGTDNALCFENIPAGDYQVAQVLPRNLELTTAPSADISVADGSTTSLEFGSRARSEVQATEVASAPTATSPAQPDADAPAEEPEAQPDEDDGGFDLLAISGLVVLFIAVALLVVVILILLRQQRA